MNISLEHYLVLSALLFCIGIYGVISRRNAIGVLMSLELMFNAANLNLVAFARYIDPGALTGQVFALFVIVIAAAEAAVGIALVLSIYRNHQTLDLENVDLMKW